MIIIIIITIIIIIIIIVIIIINQVSYRLRLPRENVISSYIKSKYWL